MIIIRKEPYMIAALAENGRIAELHVAPEAKTSVRVGDIYIGRVKKLVPNIEAAFLEIQPGLECYYSLAKNPEPFFTHKSGKKSLCIGDELLVQVEREAVKTKAPTVTSRLSFTGKYAVLTTGNTICGVSGKIQGEKRERWKQTVQEWKNDRFGIVIRTNAQDMSAEIVKKEVDQIMKEADLLIQKAASRVCFSCMKQTPPEYLTCIQGLTAGRQTEILVEEEHLYEDVREYLTERQPEDLPMLSRYQDPLLPLDKLYSVEYTIREALKERVWMKSGAYLVIQPTEALTVIDVNSGKCVLKKKDREGFLKVNLEAAREAARQIRLRNLSGIILIDFINLEDSCQQEQLLTVLADELAKDTVKAEVIDVTKLQLVEITRRKVHKPLHEAFQTVGSKKEGEDYE